MVTHPSQAHRRLAELIQRHGSPEERAAAVASAQFMREMRDTFDGEWWPIEEVHLPGFLRARAVRVAKLRHDRAQRWLTSQHGAGRSIADETRACMAQMALVIALGLDFDSVPKNHTAARKSGNVGHGISAFIPKAESHQLVIKENEPRERVMFLVEEALEPDTYTIRGWLRAAVGMRPGFQKTFVRDGVVSKPYIVPTDMLSSMPEWWKAQGWRPANAA